MPETATPSRVPDGGGSWLSRRLISRLTFLAPFLALAPLAAFGLMLVLALQAEREADRRADLQRAATALSTAVESELRGAIRVMEALAGSPRLAAGDLAGFRAEAQRVMARDPAWFSIVLTDGERQLLNLRYPAEAELPPLRDPASVASVLRTGRAQPSGLLDGFVALRVPVRIEGLVRFSLMVALEASAFARVLDRADLPRGWSAVLLDAEGRLIARAAGGAASPEALRPSLAQPREALSLGALTAYAMPVGDSRWTLVAAATPDDFATRALGWLVLAVGAAAVLAGIGVAARIASRHRGQEAMRHRSQAEALARAAEQERRRTDMLATVSHELRAPLTGLLGYTDLLAKSDLSATAKAWVEQQRRAGQALLALIGDVLDFARLDEGAVELEDADIEIAQLLEDCAGLMRSVAQQKGLGLRVQLDPGLPRWMRGDPMRLRQVATNLISNAIKFTERGEIVVSARLTARPERVEVAVVDTGIGIAPEALPRIFDRFRQESADTARRFGGSGLGLAICRRLVEAMGGAIGAESRPGQGSRFVFWVPFRPGAAPLAPAHEARLRILVAEDVAASRLLLTAVLERAGHAVTAAEDGPAALAALHGAAFDLAVLDLHMPGLDGFGVAAALRTLPGEQGRVPLIALTAEQPEEVEPACRAAGFDAVLRKPFETRRLLGLIDALRGRGGDAAGRPASAGAAMEERRGVRSAGND
ncbi:hybrid sensor histidine kinase/response regulator [Falsiroseomonas ponticola]|uniref:hybrid sensor histidine kinase/response regulator n=1 Tax=Falsiroseomonas ponticola TaxID=2786951 RepID=UPI001931DC29|nr:hybrid sensor histidine kinase/response regulator [Roseomonas ponticola]